MSEVIAHAQLPNYDQIVEQMNGLTDENEIKRLQARSRYTPPPPCKDCTGDLTIGFFFDGTNNNKNSDWGPDDDTPIKFLKQKHSNIVRLLHAFPDEDDKKENRFTAGTTNRCYRYYIPGVGTAFDKIGDSGKLPSSILGAAAGWGGEARILWALFQVINAISRFYDDKPLISDDKVLRKIENIETNVMEEATTAEKILNMLPILPLAFLTRLPSAQKLFSIELNHDARKEIIRKYIDKELVEKIKNSPKERELRQITVHVFGFSRGAAEARAFVNFLLQLGDKSNEIRLEGSVQGIKILGFPLNIQFMGLFDTVASVGVAGAFSFSEGHAAWADGTLDIPHYRVGECVHMVAGHETRACFPLDSVRTEGRYAPNLIEIVYPGAHSDLGGGYNLYSLGKDDLLKKGRPITNVGDPKLVEKTSDNNFCDDLQLARVPCFDMYCRALTAGVPFYTLDQLEAQGDIGKKYAKDLKPDLKIVEALKAYTKLSGIQTGSVEDLSWKHFELYLGWRWEQGKKYFLSEESVQKDVEHFEAKIKAIEKELSQNKSEQKQLTKKGWLGFELSKGFMVKDGKLVPNPELQALKDREEVLKDAIKRGEDEKLALMKELEGLKNGTIRPGVEVKRLKEERDIRNTLGIDEADKDAGCLENTQRALLVVTAAYCDEIKRRLKALEKDENPGSNIDHFLPLSNPLSPFAKEEHQWKKDYLQRAQKILLEVAKNIKDVPLNVMKYAKISMVFLTGASYVNDRISLLTNNFAKHAHTAMSAPQTLETWRHTMKKAGIPLQHDEIAPEREGLWLLGAIEKWSKIPPDKRKAIGDFFANVVHDSMAGFPLPEFELNGYGIAKFRRIYFGIGGDLFLRTKVARENESRRSIAKTRIQTSAAA